MEENLFTPPLSRRTPSFSSASPSWHSWDSSSSSLSYNEEFPPFSSPATFKGIIPFSWERIPGIPKHNSKSKHPMADAQHFLLPLPPPAGNLSSSVNKWMHRDEISPNKPNRFPTDDPFLAALVECSKDADAALRRRHRNTKSLSDRLGLISMYGSCKRTCAVSESLVYIPRHNSQPQHYLLNLNRRSGSGYK